MASGPSLRAVLLDLDGTLIDSHPALRAAFHRFLGAHGVTVPASAYDRWNGPALVEIVAGLAAEHGLQGDLDTLYEQYLRVLEESYVNEAPLAPGASALFDLLDDKRVLAAVVTSGPARLARALLARLGVDARLATIVCGDEVPDGKPAPDAYLEALRRLGVAAGEAIAVEDSPTGVRAAVAAGLRCLGVGPLGPRLSLAGALALGADLDEIHAIVEGRLSGPGRVIPARQFAVRAVGEAPPLDAETEARISQAWDLARTKRPSLTDGEILSVARFCRAAGRVVVDVERTRYRRFVAQRAGIPLGIRPLGVSGLVRLSVAPSPPQPCPPRIVLGRRAAFVTQYPRAWELVPSGGVPSSRIEAGGAVDCEGQLVEELTEELGAEPGAVTALAPLALVEDLDDQVVDVCYRIDVAGDEATLRTRALAGGEYDEIALLPTDEAGGAGPVLAKIEGWKAAGEVLVPTVEPLLALSTVGYGED